MKDKVDGPADCLVTEMLQCLPVGAHRRRQSARLRVGSRSDSEECRTPEAWTVLRLVFYKKPDAKLEQGLR